MVYHGKSQFKMDDDWGPSYENLRGWWFSGSTFVGPQPSSPAQDDLRPADLRSAQHFFPRPAHRLAPPGSSSAGLASLVGLFVGDVLANND